ncbi:MAG TPA: radical SAM protein [Elusimicrobiota bacterium]|nr:radical SAM protein [Elusimicrobiota bacterium]
MSNEAFLKNIEINDREMRERKIRLDSKPLLLGLILTNWCNLNCIMCGKLRHSNSRTLSRQELAKIMELLPYLQSIEWQGGEFFQLEHVKEFFTGLQPFSQIKHHITTNGLLLDPDWIELFFRLKTELFFSIDAPTASVYERIRRGGRFETLIRKLELLVGREKRLGRTLRRTLGAVVMRSNYRCLAGFGDFAKEYGFQELVVSPVMQFEDEENIFLRADADVDKELAAARASLEEQFKGTPVALKWLLPARTGPVSTVDVPAAEGRKEAFFCPLPWKSLFVCVDHRGDIFPDCWCTTPVGNIGVDGFLDVWNNEKMQAYRRGVAEGGMSLCSARCRAGHSVDMKARLVSPLL